MNASHLATPDPSDRERPVRLPCGHMGEVTASCDECDDLGGSPDPWLIAGGDVNPEGRPRHAPTASRSTASDRKAEAAPPRQGRRAAPNNRRRYMSKHQATVTVDATSDVRHHVDHPDGITSLSVGEPSDNVMVFLHGTLDELHDFGARIAFAADRHHAEQRQSAEADQS